MRIWNFALSLVVVGLGLMAWRQGDWAGTEEAFGGDGSCQGFAQLVFYSIGIGLFGVAARVLFLRKKHLVMASVAATSEPGPTRTEVTRAGLEYDDFFN